MARAKQNRRLAKRWAERLGAMSGIEDAKDFLTGRATPDELPTAHEIRAATLEGFWDEGAINAGCAKLDRCPAGCEAAYYAAYDRAACDRAKRALPVG